MRIQWQILLFIFILNLSVGAAIALNIPGTEYVNPSQPDTGVDDYDSTFNSTQIATSWKQTPFTGIPLIGDIFAGFSFFWQNIGYLIDGFPTFLYWISDTYIADAGGQAAFLIIANVFRAVYALLISTFLIEFISGRVFSD